ncbi:MAG: MBL fold metallo-hydrolase [Alphaproteobacteria bacterium]
MRLGTVLFALLLVVGCAAGANASQSDFRVTLLGTGVPIPDPNRFGPATLVEAGEQKLLFDAGRGVPVRLWQLRIPFNKVGPLFLTHFHSDHVIGIPDLWLTGWLGGPFGRRKDPFHVIGPTGTKDLMGNLERAYAADIKIRIADENYPPEGVRVVAQEFPGEGVVFEKDGVRVIAFEVDHGEHIKPSFGYRIEYIGRSVVISSDTRFSENVIKYGTGADVLIHEVMGVRPELLKDPQVRRVMDHHTSPQEAGTVFTRAAPKLAVYTHLVFRGGPGIPPLTPDEIVTQTRETYSGPLEVGEDLFSIDIAEDGKLIVRRPGEKR